jgi:hypothetical protein
MSEITYRRLVPAGLERIGEIDRIERIDTLYVQHGERLEQRSRDFSSPAWFTEGRASTRSLTRALSARRRMPRECAGRMVEPSVVMCIQRHKASGSDVTPFLSAVLFSVRLRRYQLRRAHA